MHVIVLGGYGLIGSAIIRALLKSGCQVTGIGRDGALGKRLLPGADWIARDIANCIDWRDILAGADVVINASGVLQDGARDNLRTIHVDALANITDALSGSKTRLIQISAVGVSPDASTAFFRTKAEGDAIIRASDLDHVILRPALVLAPQAYGGTALLRAAAAMPGIGFLAYPDSPVQSIHIDDLTKFVMQAVRGDIPTGAVLDLAETDPMPLGELAQKLRRWQGYKDWPLTIRVPRAATPLTGRLADATGCFGWRSPLRSTALQVLEDGIHAHPDPAYPCRPLDQILTDLPASAQDRVFARAFFLIPLVVLTLSLFWTLSGVIGLFQASDAMAILTDRGSGTGFALMAVIGGGLLDMTLGITVLWRRWTRAACLGMIATGFAYMIGAAWFAPDLWGDPLGPMVKVLPATILALIPPLLMEDR